MTGFLVLITPLSNDIIAECCWHHD